MLRPTSYPAPPAEDTQTTLEALSSLATYISDFPMDVTLAVPSDIVPKKFPMT